MKKRYIKLSILFIGLILLDQVTKYMIQTNMTVGQRIPMIPGFFSITYILNSGAAWSLLEGKMVFFYIVTIVAFVLLSWFLYSLKEDYEYLSRIGVVCMLAGTVGNFIDRLAMHCVRDFLDFIIIGYDFPVFNVADIALCVGIGFIILDEIITGLGVRKKWKLDK